LPRFCSFLLDQKRTKKSRLYRNPTILLSRFGGSEKNSPFTFWKANAFLISLGSNSFSLVPPPHLQNRDFCKAGPAPRLEVLNSSVRTPVYESEVDVQKGIFAVGATKTPKNKSVTPKVRSDAAIRG
jgi:hypothetical protein